jgi:hypothetical protein
MEKVTKEYIESQIKDRQILEYNTKSGHLMLICILTLASGFTVSSNPIFITGDKASHQHEPTEVVEVVEVKTKYGSVLRWALKEFKQSGIFAIGEPSATIIAGGDNPKIGTEVAIENMEESHELGHSTASLAIDYNEAIKKIRVDAFNKIWALEGYHRMANEVR